MNAKSPEHHHSGSHHPHASKAGWKPHRDWRVWGVVLMLLAMAAYVLSLDESLTPGGGAPQTPVPADAP